MRPVVLACFVLISLGELDSFEESKFFCQLATEIPHLLTVKLGK